MSIPRFRWYYAVIMIETGVIVGFLAGWALS